MREAEDGPAFREELTQETGLRLWVIDGTEEARLSAQGVLLGWPEATGLVCDIGGSSLELAELSGGQVGKRETSALGPWKLRDVPGGKKGLKAHIKAELGTLRSRIDGTYDRMFLVGGSWRAIARLDMIRRQYPLAVLHEYRMSPRAVSETLAMIERHPADELRAMSGIGEARMALLPEAAQVLGPLIRTFRPKEIAISAYGIREGLLYEQMPQKLRNRDPLIEACRYMESQSARIPGFGRALYEFLKPLFASERPGGRRLIKAACLLHDISWRAHPDYRAEVCFDTATRANLGGLSHSERIFLGLALLHRYKNSRSGTRFETFFELLSEKEQAKAEVLGKAMRFGAMLAAQDASKMGQLKLYPKKKVLELRMPLETRDLFGEVARSRFNSLASALDAEPRVLI
jgi:exopolyphosphatase/guanosine-5'-triphosphate,3'-diphosphate pyrophosphatase